MTRKGYEHWVYGREKEKKAGRPEKVGGPLMNTNGFSIRGVVGGGGFSGGLVGVRVGGGRKQGLYTLANGGGASKKGENSWWVMRLRRQFYLTSTQLQI